MNTLEKETLTLREITPDDLFFLYQVYASTRMDEMVLTGWPQQQIDWFLQMQFNLQHSQWQQNNPDAEFNLILLDNTSVGRLYIDHREKQIHIIDIAILPEFRGKGIGTYFLNGLKEEAHQKAMKLSLYVEKNNPARFLYQKIGFRVVEDGEVYHLMEIE